MSSFGSALFGRVDEECGAFHRDDNRGVVLLDGRVGKTPSQPRLASEHHVAARPLGHLIHHNDALTDDPAVDAQSSRRSTWSEKCSAHIRSDEQDPQHGDRDRRRALRSKRAGCEHRYGRSRKRPNRSEKREEGKMVQFDGEQTQRQHDPRRSHYVSLTLVNVQPLPEVA